MRLYDDKFRPIHGYEEGKADAIDVDSSARALAYKKDFLKRFIPIDQRQIERRLGGGRYYVTRKYDGEYAFLIHDAGRTVAVNRSGRVRYGIPCIEEAGRLIAAAAQGEVMMAAEMYVDTDRGRGRVDDLLSALADKRRIGRLRLAVFDLIEWDSKPWRAAYPQTWEKLHALFDRGELVHAVDMCTAASAAEVVELYERWVVKERSEGLVVRGDLPLVYKIKPRHSLDAVVVGFSEGAGAEKGEVRSLLLALMPSEGRYQVVGRVGSGLTETVRKSLYKEFAKTILPSEFIETDANQVAFRMVRPETVIEITVGDLLYETESGPKINPLLEIDGGSYRIVDSVAGVRLLAPVFERVRTDKKADAGDVRLAQIGRFASPAEAVRVEPEVPREPLPPSELLFREVYLKTLGEKIMVQKYMVWKTNKERAGEYPAYVLYVANFSSQRQVPLQRDVDISDSREQIRELLRRALEKNLKSGWRKVASLPARERPPRETVTAKPEKVGV